MTKQPTKKAKEVANKISPRTLAALIISLMVISIFPLYATFFIGIGPEPGLIVTDLLYLLVLAGFLAVFTGRYRPKWLIVTLIGLGVLSLIGLFWLYTVLGSLKPTL